MDTQRIATILDDGTYGERDMTSEEQAEWAETVANIPEPPEVV